MKKKIAIIGFGGMGSWHVNHALKSDVLDLAGIYDIDPIKGQRIWVYILTPLLTRL